VVQAQDAASKYIYVASQVLGAKPAQSSMRDGMRSITTPTKSSLPVARLARDGAPDTAPPAQCAAKKSAKAACFQQF
jgi:hypothetical protein